MKSKSEIAAAVFVILTALHDNKKAPHGTSIHGVPNGHLYAQLMGVIEFDDWNLLICNLVTARHITQQNYLLKITDKGETLRSKLDEIYSTASK